MTSNLISKLATSYSHFAGPPGTQSTGGKYPLRKRRREEILSHDVETNILNKKFRSSMWRPEIASARQSYMKEQMTNSDLSMPYVQRDTPAINYPRRNLAPLPPLQVPAFGKDRIEELGGKFDLIMNTLTSLYGVGPPPTV